MVYTDGHVWIRHSLSGLPFVPELLRQVVDAFTRLLTDGFDAALQSELGGHRVGEAVDGDV